MKLTDAMVSSGNYSTALGELRGAQARFLADSDPDSLVRTRDEVLARYGPLFTWERIEGLDPAEFRSFLYFENNKHWSGLYRRGLRASENMPKLIKGLRLLLDESKPIASRYMRAIQIVPGMGKAIATAILTVAYPKKYGVWNNTSEAALKRLDIWPSFVYGDGPGGQYEKVNDVLLRLSHDLEMDLWTLDWLLWFVVESAEGLRAGDESGSSMPEHPPVELGGRFALERHLEEFLIENWDRTHLGKDWAVFEDDGDRDAGAQYPTPIGRIDILARHRTEPRWLVVELKRGQTGDVTVGQVLRYMGWIRAEMAAPGESVEGLILAHAADPAIRYALAAIPNVTMMSYEVRFDLHDVAVPTQGRGSPHE